MTTVGYREVFELSDGGKLVVMLFLAVGIGVFLFSIVQLGEIVVRAEEALGERHGSSWHRVRGDATDGRVLEEAGLHRARGLAIVLRSDAANLYVVMSARLVCPELMILARAGDEKAAAKMEKAGANRVVSLYSTGAMKAVQLLSSLNVEDFVELITGGGREMGLAEILLTAEAPYSGKTLAQTDLRERGVMIVGIRRANGDLLMPSPSTESICSGDFLIAPGPPGEIEGMIAES